MLIAVGVCVQHTMPNWIVTVTVFFAAAGALAVLVPAWLRMRAARPPMPSKPRLRNRDDDSSQPVIAFECPVCQNEVAFAKPDLRPLSPSEIALTVGQRKEAVGRSLSEATCPHCEARFTFLVDTKQPELLGANIYHAQQKGNRCVDCGKLLKRPPWDREKIVTRDQVIESLDPLYGLDCDHCGAVCCVACCEEVSRNRSTDNTLMCPRCRRRPMQTLHYF